MSLRNTDSIYGLVVFTGHETKVMMNSAEDKYKKSRLEKFTDTAVKYLFVIQICATFVLAVFAYFPMSTLFLQLQESPHANYLAMHSKPDFGTIIKIMCTWILLFVNLVPISLMISLDVVKLIQASFMQVDVMMYDKEEEMPMRAQASNLNEELGQIDYVFSDKTGTLTQNVMEFKKFTAGALAYGLDSVPPGNQLPNVNFHDPKLQQVLNG